ncbi:PREDICTED: germ cell-specific gene 1-like protein [Branchiostoma belcheri]|uniref:Germ cell-specific gene 1-like protein n=1 Tax=Branchiostoma belcheri TaxID=7741 RepID=A0A6P5AFC9_BRABE|nr:PREDICTED: germ cell-specific gene 1-like protein [Branchiostoma belcheri]
MGAYFHLIRLASVLFVATIALSCTAFVTSHWTVGLHRHTREQAASNETTKAPKEVAYYTTFHSGYWQECKQIEEFSQAENCTLILAMIPDGERNEMYMSIGLELLSILLLMLGTVFNMAACCRPGTSPKVTAITAVLAVLAGLTGMLSRMMFITIFRFSIEIGPEDQKPYSWTYGWSFMVAWGGFLCCMVTAISVLHAYTIAVLEKQERWAIEQWLQQSAPLVRPEPPPPVSIPHTPARTPATRTPVKRLDWNRVPENMIMGYPYCQQTAI